MFIERKNQLPHNIQQMIVLCSTAGNLDFFSSAFFLRTGLQGQLLVTQNLSGQSHKVSVCSRTNTLNVLQCVY